MNCFKESHSWTIFYQRLTPFFEDYKVSMLSKQHDYLLNTFSEWNQQGGLLDTNRSILYLELHNRQGVTVFRRRKVYHRGEVIVWISMINIKIS